jgi:hypothetical protein
MKVLRPFIHHASPLGRMLMHKRTCSHISQLLLLLDVLQLMLSGQSGRIKRAEGIQLYAQNLFEEGPAFGDVPSLMQEPSKVGLHDDCICTPCR